MRLVLDTNVLVAALTARGFCAEILVHCVKRHDLVSSPYILEEFSRVLREKFRYTSLEVSRAVVLIREKSELLEPTPLPRQVCRDRTDDPILGTALSGNCDCIVTGDPDLLAIKKFKGIHILSPRDFWKYESQ